MAGACDEQPAGDRTIRCIERSAVWRARQCLRSTAQSRHRAFAFHCSRTCDVLYGRAGDMANGAGCWHCHRTHATWTLRTSAGGSRSASDHVERQCIGGILLCPCIGRCMFAFGDRAGLQQLRASSPMASEVVLIQPMAAALPPPFPESVPEIILRTCFRDCAIYAARCPDARVRFLHRPGAFARRQAAPPHAESA